MTRTRKVKTKSDSNKSTSSPQFTESIAMIMEQFKNPPHESRFKKILLGLIKYAIVFGLMGGLIYIGFNTIENISFNQHSNSTHIIITYKP